ncbi:LysR family transcriptional regulator [Thalassolituus sp.]|uniref:LysR family transcriptional regulator n=1 Tax=Thalassolituus sp. TaxID=2030822 RepID=UPI0035136F38
MRYTLRQLEVFLAIAQAGNLTRAATQLNMSQSAASSALKDLENQFDLLLFDRVGKRLQLSDRGQQLRHTAERLMAMADDLEQSLLNNTSTGPLDIGATLSIGNYLAVQMVARFKTLHPDSPITLDVENTEHIAERVLNFELDIGMIEGEFQHPQLDIRPWRQDEMTVFCSPDHPLAEAGKLTDEQLVATEWILRETGSGTRQAFDRAMSGLLPKMNIALELQHTEAIKRAVQANLGVGCLSLMTLQDELDSGRLVRLDVPGRDLTRTLYLILHKQKYHSMGIQAWISLCEEWSS